MPGPIDLRSDTVTRPTARMRRAMAEADVGDDWYGDDPSVNRLQDRCAEAAGKDAAVFVPTGTMANQIAVHVFARAGRLVVAEASAHVATTEVVSSALLTGVGFVRVPADRGRLGPDRVAEALRPDPYEADVVDLVAVENTHGASGGTVLPLDDLRGIRKAAGEAGVPLYLDGARIFNASVASGVPVHEYGAEVDALMLSLSKGLGAPVGSVLCGTADFARAARRAKILFGGGWRQAGILAAAGLVALEEGPGRLHEDHENARRLGEAIEDIAPGTVDLEAVQTNMVYADTAAAGADPWAVMERLRESGVLVNVLGNQVRLVTHRDVSAGDVDRAVAVWRRVMGEMRKEGG